MGYSGSGVLGAQGRKMKKTTTVLDGGGGGKGGQAGEGDGAAAARAAGLRHDAAQASPLFTKFISLSPSPWVIPPQAVSNTRNRYVSQHWNPSWRQCRPTATVVLLRGGNTVTPEQG